MDSKMVNISSPSAVAVGFIIFEVTPRLLQPDVVGDPPYIEVPVFFCIIYKMLKHVNGKFKLPLSLLSEFSGFASRRDNNSSVYIEAAFVVVISYAELLQVSWSYIWLALFPVSSIGFIFSLRSKLNDNLRNGSPQECDVGEQASAGDLGSGEEIKEADQEQEHFEEGEASAGDLGSGEEIKKAEEQEHDGEGEAGAGRGGDPRGGEETKKAEDGQEFVTAVPLWMFYILRQFHGADNFAVSLFLLFLSFTLGALAQMMARLALSGAAPGGAPASALLRKASLVVLLVAAHAVAVELLGEQAVLFVLPELAPLLLWLSVHVDRAREGPIVTADRITFSRNLVSAVAVVVMACLAATMDESILFFSWVAKAVVSCGVSGLLVFYIASMISQWRQGQDCRATATPLLEETVELLKVWAKVLLITATALLVPTCMAALRLGLHEQMLAAPAEFFNNYVTNMLS